MLYVVAVLYVIAGVVAGLFAARFFVEWLDEVTYKPRMRNRK
jgi:Ca2+/Na+ antiporter